MNPVSGKLPRPLLVAATLRCWPRGCTPTVTTHGHPLDQDQLAQIKPGVTSREEVTRLLGSPSTIGTFDRSVGSTSASATR